VESRVPRVWLIGESNPYGDDPEFALYPLPVFATGGRLAKVLGMDADEYLEAFERRNLLTGSGWSVTRARAAADEILMEHGRGDKLVLLGAKVAEAFYVAFRVNLCSPRQIPVGYRNPVTCDTLVLPHPSGRSREWNKPGMAARVRAAVEELRGHPARHEVPPR
jgi:hypothetical protein